LIYSFYEFYCIFARRNFLTGQSFEENNGKEVVFYTSLTVIIAFLSSGFKPLEIEANQWFLIKTQME
jgi:hypothetical protein